jgi:hypothetical protein
MNEKFLDLGMQPLANKIVKYMPGTHIYIKNCNKTLLNKVGYTSLGAWNFKEEIFKKEKRYTE